MRKGILTFGLLALGGWWLWKKSRAGLPASASLSTNGAPNVFGGGVNAKTGTVSVSLPPLFQGRLTGPIEDKAVKSIPIVDV